MKNRTREYLIPIALTVVVLTLSFFLHVKWCGSTMRQSQELWQARLDLHQSTYPFSIRYFTTYSTLLIKNIFNLPPRESFFTIQFLLAFIMGPLFYRYLRLLSFDRIWSNIGLFLLLSAYPILGAHIAPVYTWDDFWVYIFIILTFSALIKGQFLMASFFFTLGLFAREQTLILWPAVVLGYEWLGKQYPQWKRRLLYFLPLLIYLPFLFLATGTYPAGQPTRFEHLAYNFENYLRGSDSIFSFLISFGFIWPAAVISIVQLWKSGIMSATTKLLVWSTIISVPPTILAGFCLAKARETRIFFPPFIFLIPLALILIQGIRQNYGEKMTIPARRIFLIFMPVLLAAGIALAPLIFAQFDFRNCPRFHQQAFGFHLGLVLIMGVYYLLRRNVTNYKAGS